MLFDVAVIGGGPSGSAAAITLARNRRRVILLERSEYQDVRSGEVLSPRARVALGQLGVWDRFLAQRHNPSHGIAWAWGHEHLEETPFILNPYGHGWHIDRRSFDEGLADAAADAGACVVRGARVVSCTAAGSPAWMISFLRAGQPATVSARFCIDATGRPSAVARAQCAPRIIYDRLVAIVSSFPCAASIDGTDSYTLVEAVENGWWYSARLPDSRVVVVYMTDADLMPARKGDLCKKHQRLLRDAAHTSARIRCCRGEIELRVRSANSSMLARVSGPNWLAVGDAAMAYDPLSAQGISRALESGIHAAETIVFSRASNLDTAGEYDSRVQQTFMTYLKRRADYYRREPRWPHSTFWTRRRQDGDRHRHAHLTMDDRPAMT